MNNKTETIKKFIRINFEELILVLFFLLFGIELLNAQINNEENKKYPSIEIPSTQLHEIYSTIADQEYILQINLPRDFGDATKTFPVVYLLDGQWDFSLFSTIYEEQYFDGFLSSLIIVGITWGVENPIPDELRARDFIPTDIEQNLPTGNAPKFIEFIEKELVPFMELNYQASPNDRVLMGSSLGGLFTLYTLFNHPHIFNKYVLTSPELGWENSITDTYEKNYPSSDSQLPAKLYMTFGEKRGELKLLTSL